MEQENKKEYTPGDDSWLDSILDMPEAPKELGPDELAVQAAGLTHPDDLELEKILSEDWDSVPDLDPVTHQPVVAEENAQESAEEQAEDPEEAPAEEAPAEEATQEETAEAAAEEPPAEKIPTEEAPAEEAPAADAE